MGGISWFSNCERQIEVPLHAKDLKYRKLETNLVPIINWLNKLKYLLNGYDAIQHT